MAYAKAHYDLQAPKGRSQFHEQLGLKNLGVTILTLGRGEGFDFFHNHREQEEVYLCLQGEAELRISGDELVDGAAKVQLERGDVVRVDARTLRAIGNAKSDLAVVLIAGACPHPYPAGFGHHDVIADVLQVVGRGETGFKMPSYVTKDGYASPDDEC